MARTTDPVSQATPVAYEYVGLSRRVLLAELRDMCYAALRVECGVLTLTCTPRARKPRSETSTVPYSNGEPSRTKSLVEMLLERGCDCDLAEAEAAIDRMENRPVDFRWAASDIAVLLLRVLQSESRGEEAAYQDWAQRYRAIANITWLRGAYAVG